VSSKLILSLENIEVQFLRMFLNAEDRIEDNLNIQKLLFTFVVVASCRKSIRLPCFRHIGMNFGS